MSDDGTDRGDSAAGVRASPSDTWPDRYEIVVSFAALDGTVAVSCGAMTGMSPTAPTRTQNRINDEGLMVLVGPTPASIPFRQVPVKNDSGDRRGPVVRADGTRNAYQRS
jgi:hypothetical protein